MSGGRRGGERRRACAQSACTRRRHEKSSHALGRRVLHSVLRPVHVDPHYARGGKTPRGGACDSASRLSKPTQVGTINTGVRRVDVVRLAACHRFRKGEAWHARKGRRSRPPSLRGSRAPVGLLARRVSVAEVGRRRLASNKLGKRAPKRAAGSSERGPSSERRSAGETVGKRFE